MHNLTITATGSPGLSNLFITDATIYGLQDDPVTSSAITTSSASSTSTSLTLSTSTTTTSPFSSTPESSSIPSLGSGTTSNAALIGGLVGGLLGLCLVAVIFWVLRRRRRMDIQDLFNPVSDKREIILPASNSGGAGSFGGFPNSFPDTPTSCHGGTLQLPVYSIEGSQPDADAQAASSISPTSTTPHNTLGYSGTASVCLYKLSRITRSTYIYLSDPSPSTSHPVDLNPFQDHEHVPSTNNRQTSSQGSRPLPKPPGNPRRQSSSHAVPISPLDGITTNPEQLNQLVEAVISRMDLSTTQNWPATSDSEPPEYRD